MAVGHSVTDELCGWLEGEDTLGLREGVRLEVCPKATGINAQLEVEETPGFGNGIMFDEDISGLGEGLTLDEDFPGLGEGRTLDEEALGLDEELVVV